MAATAAPLLAPARPAQLNALAHTASRVRAGTRADRRCVRPGARGQRGAAARWARATRRGPRSRRRCAARRYQRSRHSATLREDLLATAAPVLRRGRVTGAVRITQSVAAVHRAVRRSIAGPRADRRGRARARDGRRLADRAPARAAAAAPRGDRRRDRARRAGPARARGGDARAALARALVQRDDRSAVARAAGPAASSWPTRRTSSARRSPGLRLRLEEAQAVGERARARRRASSTPRWARSTGSRTMVDELLLLSSAGGRDAPAGGGRARRRAARAAAERWRRDRGGARHRADARERRRTDG